MTDEVGDLSGDLTTDQWCESEECLKNELVWNKGESLMEFQQNWTDGSCIFGK